MDPSRPLLASASALLSTAADPATPAAASRAMAEAAARMLSQALQSATVAVPLPAAGPAPVPAPPVQQRKRARPYDPALAPAAVPVPALQLAADPRWLAVEAAEWSSRAQTLALLGLWPARAHVDTRALRQLAARTLPAELRAALQGRRARGEGPEAEEARRRRSRAQTACSDKVTALLRRVYGQQVVQWVGAG